MNEPTTLPTADEKLLQLRLNQIERDGNTQSRAGLSSATIAEYAELIGAGADFPPIVVYYDGYRYWLASGFHRWHAHEQAGQKTIRTIVRQGDVRAARLFSAACNHTHGLQRSNEDKRHAVGLLLDDVEWRQWPARKIAAHCGVSHTLVYSEKEKRDPRRDNWKGLPKDTDEGDEDERDDDAGDSDLDDSDPDDALTAVPEPDGKPRPEADALDLIALDRKVRNLVAKLFRFAALMREPVLTLVRRHAPQAKAKKAKE